MQHSENEFEIQPDSLDKNQQLKKLLFRILPFWPLIILFIVIGFLSAKIYLRYATAIYAVKARVIVNDDTQQQTSNLLDVMQQLDTRNMSTETEKEMEILQSRNLLSELATNLQLNVQFSSKGYIKSGPEFSNLPIELKLAHPDSISSSFSGNVEAVGSKVKFNGITYPCDTFIKSDYGIIKWHINNENLHNRQGDWFVKVSTIDTTVTDLQKNLTIDPISKQSSIVDITFTDPLPERGLNFLTNLLALYGSSTIDYKSRMSENTLKFLDERLTLVSEDLSDVEKRLQNFKTKNKIVDLSEQGKGVLDQLQNSDSKISDLQVQLDVLNKIQQYVSNRNNSGNEVPATLGISDPVLMDLLNQLYKAEFELQKTRQTTGNKNPKIAILEQTINRLKPSILASIGNLKTGIQTSLQQLKSDNNSLSSILNTMPKKERQLLDISRQQGIKNDIYTFLLQKREEAAINAASIVANYRVIEDPELNGLIKPKSSIIYLAGVLIGLVLVSIFIYIKEFSSTKIKFRSQIEDRTKIPIIAEIGYEPHDNKNPIVIEEGKRSLVAEEFRELRTNLSYITFNSDIKNKVILVTSSIPSEGKSFVSINTSISLCLTGSKLVLLEFDLRKPKISKELGVKSNKGLSNFLIRTASAEEIIYPHNSISNFYIIPSGPIPPNPAELISGNRLNELFDYLKEHFDYIIIDSPPVGAVTDAKILANVADATLYIMRQNFTDSSFIDFINDLQKKKNFPNFNIVFNGIKMRPIPGYGYGNSYGYGYKYGYNSGAYGYSESPKVKPWWKFWVKS